MNTIEKRINERFNAMAVEAKAIKEMLSKKGYGMMGDAIDRLHKAGVYEASEEAEEAQIIPGVEIWETRPADAISYLRKVNDCDNTHDTDYDTKAKDEYMHHLTVAELKARGAIPFDGTWVYSSKIDNEVKRRKSKLRDDLRFMADKLTDKIEDDREQWLKFAEYNNIVMTNQAKCSAPYRLDFADYLSDAKTERLNKVKNFSRAKMRERGFCEIVIAIDDAFSDFKDMWEDEMNDDCPTEIMWYDGEINAETVSTAATGSLYCTTIMTPGAAEEDEDAYEEELAHNDDDDYNDDDDDGYANPFASDMSSDDDYDEPDAEDMWNYYHTN